MSGTRRPFARLLVAAAAVGLAGPVWGQVHAPPIEDEPEPAAADQNGFGVVAVMADENFDQWVFGGGRSAAQARRRFDALLSLQVEDVDRVCGLSGAQKAKLRLAGRGDVKRFFDRVEQKRKRFLLVKNDQNKVGEIFQEIQPLQTTMNSGPFGEGSLFAKTLKTTLDPGQAAEYAKISLDKRKFRYRAKIELVVAMLDDVVGFRAEQRRKLAALLAEETEPPRKYGQYDLQVILLQASRVPEAKIRPLFDDAQWRLMGRQFAQARGMEPFLRTNGFLPGPDPPPARPRAVRVLKREVAP